MNTYAENYPVHIVLLSNLLNIALYALGSIVMWEAHEYLLLPYLLLVIYMEVKVLRNSCTRCHYYGKLCAFGKGKLSSFFFRRNETERLCDVKITTLSFLTDASVSLIPIITAIILIIMNFNFIILLYAVIILVLTTGGNAVVRGQLACNHCSQKELGCPAEAYFNKKQ